MQNNLKITALKALENLKAENIVTLDVKEITSITDWMIICNARSSRHMQAVAEEVITQAKKAGFKPLGMDGKNSTEWVLVDLGDVVVHIMMPETREFYQLEKLWE